MPARSGPAWWRCLSITALAVGLGGCAATQYEPTVPMRARSRDVEVSLKAVRVGSTKEFVFSTRSTAAHAVQRGWLTVATRAPCTGGAEAGEIVIDHGVVPSGELAPGAHELRVRFLRGPEDLSLDLVFDLAFDDGLCLRAPVISQSLPLTVPRRLVLVGSNALDGTSDLSGLRALYGLRIGGGGWLGPLLLTAEAGVAVAICSAGTCGKREDGSLHSGFAIPLSAEVRYPTAVFVVNNWSNTISVGARYSFSSVSLPALGGDRRLGVHGYQAVLAWGYHETVKGPHRHRERGPLWELSVPIGVLVAPQAAGDSVVFGAGFGLRYLLPL